MQQAKAYYINIVFANALIFCQPPLPFSHCIKMIRIYKKSLYYVGFLLLLINCCFISNDTRAQFSFRHLGTSDGLIQGSNYYFLEDTKGFIWISSQGGLNRFDGQTLKSYTHDPVDKHSIGKGEIRGLAEAPDGNIWLGSEVSLNKYVRATDRFESYFLKDKRGQLLLSQHHVVHADSSKVIYLNDQEGLVEMFYKTGKKQVLFKNAEFAYSSRSDIVYFDQDEQTIWLLLSVGLIKINLITGKKTFAFTGRKDDISKEELHIYALCKAGRNAAWLSTDKGPIKVDRENYEVHHVGINMSTDLVYSLAVDRNQSLWLATSKSGLINYDPGSKRVIYHMKNNPYVKNSLARDHLSKIFLDSRGQIWVNTDPAGVDIVFSNSLTLQKFEDDPRTSDDFNNASIRGISEDFDGNIWVGTSGEEIRMIEKNGRITRPGINRGVPHASVRGIFTDSDGGVWVSTVKQLVHLRRGDKNFREIRFNGPDLVKSNYIKGVIEIQKNVYLVATMAGIYKYASGHSKLLTSPSIQLSGAMHYRQSSRQLFVGRSEKDLRCYQLQGDTLLPLYNKLPGHNILDFAENSKISDDILWIGTDNGLVKYDTRQRKVLRHLSTRDGLPDQVVYTVLKDDHGLMWMSTNNGLARMLPDESILTLRHTRRIEFNSFAAFKAHDGSLYFGSAQGLYRFNPTSFQKPSSRGLVVSLTTISDSIEKKLSVDDYRPLVLAHDENNLSFNLSALDYLFSIEPLYEYRITTGPNAGKWISNGTSSVIALQNLPPKDYSFEFRAIDANGFYTNLVRAKITIKPPFWLSWWFVFLVLLSLALLIYAVVKAYLKRQEVSLQRLSSRIISAQESERLRIAMDIHDDVNNTLAAAKGYLQSAQAERSENIEISRNLILKATEDLRNITHDLMPVQFEQTTLSEVLEKRVLEWNEDSPVDFIFIFAGEYRKLRPESELMIYRIITEVVNNIKKHSKATRSIIQLIYQEKSVVISVEDNGVGLLNADNRKKNGKGIGLKNIYSRAEYLKASLEISSDQHGVLVQLDVPYDFNRKD